MKTSNHKTRTRERMSAPQGQSSREQRRAMARKVATLERKQRIRERVKANPTLVRFTF